MSISRSEGVSVIFREADETVVTPLMADTTTTMHAGGTGCWRRLATF
jgi:hypothetical protein